ncbi:unnamed protein product, partial [Amoebophrya sp. A25]|eukprot:GSA25T00021488001.1
MDMDLIDTQLSLEHERAIARALKRVPGVIRDVGILTRADKISAKLVLLHDGSFVGVSNEQTNSLMTHLFDRYSAISDEQNACRALAGLIHMMPLLPDANAKVLCEVAAAHTYVEGAAKARKGERVAKCKTLAVMNTWNQGKGRAYCLQASSYLKQLAASCDLMQQATWRRRVEVLYNQLLPLIN